MALFGKDLGIHLGSVNTVICEGDEVLLYEPTVVAIDSEELKIVEVGRAAREMDGRTPEIIEVMRPLHEGVIADFEVTHRMLGYFIEKVCGPARLFKPRVMITVPEGATSVERRAVHEAALQAGSRQVYLIQEPLAAAIGIGLPIATPSGNMVVSLGGGSTQTAVLAMSGIVTAHTVRSGGTRLDEAIAAYVRKKYGLIIGGRTAEEAKIRIGAATSQDESRTMEIQGQDQVTRPAAADHAHHRRGRRSDPGDAPTPTRLRTICARADPARTRLRHHRPGDGRRRRGIAAARDRQVADARDGRPGLPGRRAGGLHRQGRRPRPDDARTTSAALAASLAVSNQQSAISSQPSLVV
jgi:MreB/Mrl family cell shape determining protein